MANLKASNKFTRGLRLLKAKEFNQVFSAPLAKQTCAGFLVLVKPNLATHARLGFVFGKKISNLLLLETALSVFLESIFAITISNWAVTT